MKPEIKRLFINNLENNVTKEEIHKKFSNYGTVKSIEIKERKNPVGDQTEQFAYINISAEDHTLHTCIEEFARKEWKGQFLNVQVAKESFIDRLKREREQKDVKISEPVLNGSPEIKPINININRYKQRHSLNTPNQLGNIDDGTLKKFEGTNYNEDNEKRLKSLTQMKEGYRQQKLQIKNALSRIDKANATNKIRFDNDPDNTFKKSKNDGYKQHRDKMQLFDEDDNEDLNFSVQDQFDGIRGQKLMQLQSRFRNDDRFKMDSRFLEEDDETQNEFTKNTDLLENETEKQLEILESVIGKKLKRLSSSKDVIDKKKTKMMLRFDPSQPQHSQFEMHQEIVKEQRPKKKEKKVAVKLVEEQSQPEVSKETFYKVASDLKTTFNEREGFNLSELFSCRIQQEKRDTEEPIVKPKILNKTLTTSDGQKVFKYDSSDEDDDDEKNKTEAQQISSEPNEVKNPGLQIKPRMWTETFFFKDDDYRLQEGFDFIMRMKHGEQENFNVVRRNLKQIIRAKVKNNLRKNKPFKRKLGGNKKRLKIKRALKR